MIVEGQVHGGVAQGIAEALYEEAMYDESGNLTTSTMTQYLIPSATEIPAMTTDHSQETPSTTNPLGVKGIGEAGTIAAPPAAVNAVIDAVSHLGRHRDREAGVARTRLASDPGGEGQGVARFRRGSSRSEPGSEGGAA